MLRKLKWQIPGEHLAARRLRNTDIAYVSKMISNFFSNKYEKFSLSLISVHFISTYPV